MTKESKVIKMNTDELKELLELDNPLDAIGIIRENINKAEKENLQEAIDLCNTSNENLIKSIDNTKESLKEEEENPTPDIKIMAIEQAKINIAMFELQISMYDEIKQRMEAKLSCL